MDAVTQNIVALVAVYALIGVTLALCILYSKRHPDKSIRKIIHIMIGNFVFVWWMFTDPWIMEIFFIIPFAVLILYSVIKEKNSTVVDRAVKEGSRTGLLFYVISIGILVALLFGHFAAASAGILAMTYGDCMGSVIGKRWGKHRTINGKSLEGSLAVFVFSAAAAFAVLTLYSFLIAGGYYSGDVTGIIPIWAMCIIAGAVSAVLELLVPGDFDNLAVPLGTAATLCLLGL